MPKSVKLKHTILVIKKTFLHLLFEFFRWKNPHGKSLSLGLFFFKADDAVLQFQVELLLCAICKPRPACVSFAVFILFFYLRSRIIFCLAWMCCMLFLLCCLYFLSHLTFSRITVLWGNLFSWRLEQWRLPYTKLCFHRIYIYLSSFFCGPF